MDVKIEDWIYIIVGWMENGDCQNKRRFNGKLFETRVRNLLSRNLFAFFRTTTTVVMMMFLLFVNVIGTVQRRKVR